MDRPVDASQLQYSGESVLVTGGASFIGSHLVELLVAQGARVTVADDFSSGSTRNLKNVADGIKILAGDLRDSGFTARAVSGVDTIFHLAALHGGRGYIDSTRLSVRTTCYSTTLCSVLLLKLECADSCMRVRLVCTL